MGSSADTNRSAVLPPPHGCARLHDGVTRSTARRHNCHRPFFNIEQAPASRTVIGFESRQWIVNGAAAYDLTTDH
jgi:hypothetical protein